MSTTHLSYLGKSMRPTFRDGDELEVVGYECQEDVRRGDVVVFSLPAQDEVIAHRVILKRGFQFRTRGDFNDHADTHITSFAGMSGKVVKLRRGRRISGVSGGLKGLVIHYLLRIYYKTTRSLSRRLWPAYNRIACAGWFHGWHGIVGSTRRVVFLRQGEIEYQLIWRDQCIAVRRAGFDMWHVRFPFRLFIDFSSIS